MGKVVADKKVAVRKRSATKARSTEQVLIRLAQRRGRAVVGSLGAGGFQAIIRRSPLGMEDWAYSIHVPAGTLASRIKAGTGFDALESERLMLVDLVMRRGLEVFGNKDKFKRWLDRPHKLLGDHTPKQMLNSMDNIAEVLTELGRIEHGVF